ncbi:branched-chain amino acid transport system substrate-binding protein [Desulfohalotomaculum tongense]|uniref:ABC transporter substrate-binding protein n=1 Tax=Desulforadius tongensis TaxID=1216062 RepID=UPI00195B51B3|nr:ABC transporter substrate-binding protein [Desulforadius tongensis]MBM7854718.1 branched-chain amino acid transport system substrate-binding protein [Desulforadius tongensis]
MKKKGLLLTIMVLLTLALLAAGCGGEKDSKDTAASGSGGGDTIKIGFLGATTGDQADFGSKTLAGMKMAAEDLNKEGGVLGKKIEIVEEDHGSKLSEGVNVVQKLINRDKVVAIVGDPTTGITKAVAPIAESSHVVLLSAGAVGANVVNTEDGKLREYVYRNTLLDAVAAPAVVKYLAEELGWKKVAIVTTKDLDYSVGLTKIFKKALADNGIEVVTEETIMDKDRNFAATVTAIKPHQPDGIVFTGYYTAGGLFMKEVKKQGLDINMVGGDGLLGSTLWEMGGEAVNGSMVYCGFEADPSMAQGKTKDFIERYSEANNGEMPNMFVAQGYDAVMMLADAIKAANSDDPVKFKEEIKKLKNWQGVSGTITIRENHEPLKSPVYLLEVVEGENGQQFKVKAAIPVEG